MRRDLFPVSVWCASIPASDLALLRMVCAGVALEPHPLVSGSLSSYATPGQLLNTPVLAPVRDRLTLMVNSYAHELGIDDLRISNSWFNKLEQGHSVLPHRHELSVLSGAVYIRADAGAPGLRLHSPLTAFRGMERVQQAQGYSAPQEEIAVEEGTVILFPSWLEHSTRPSSVATRWTMSFNTIYTRSI